MRCLLILFYLTVLCNYDCFGSRTGSFIKDSNDYVLTRNPSEEYHSEQIVGNEEDNYSTYEDTSYYNNNDKSQEDDSTWFYEPELKVRVKYIKQYVDQMNPQRATKWYMKCLQNTVFWKSESPIYLYIGGNQPLVADLLMKGLMFDLANETGGVMFAAEHRFYGGVDVDYDLSYLNSQQALADLNYLLTDIKKEPAYQLSKVVAVGGGYGGSLAVWLKKFYPASVDAVLASGAPLLAKLDFHEYLKQVNIDFENHAPKKCMNYINIAYNNFVDCNEKFSTVCIDLFQPLCKDIDMTKQENRMLYYLDVSNVFSESAEKGIQYIHRACKQLHNMDYYVRDIGGLPYFWNVTNQCNDYEFEHFIENIKNNKKHVMTKYWLYQCCNEFGFFQTTSSVIPDTSYITLEFYIKICHDVFSPAFEFNETKMEEGIKRTNDLYGGLEPNVKGVVLSYGEMDPWKLLGAVNHPIYNTSQVVMIPGISHCRELLPRNSSDSKSLVKARRKIKKIIKTSIGL